MKKLIYLLTAFLLTGVAYAGNTTTLENTILTNRILRGYGNSFIFVEQGVEFSVFPDGQFDFNVLDCGPNFNAYANFSGVSISFNTGFSYDAYVQYDDFGAVIQIENVPIYYDYYGRIVRAGDVRIRYNNRGYVTRVGGLYINYNRYNQFTYCTGYINIWNRYYVYRPWHVYYAAPAYNSCIVYNRPYRQYYTPVRHTYYRPYRDNYRPQVSYNADRRGSAVARNTEQRSDRYRQSRNGRRDAVAQILRRDNRVERTGKIERRRTTLSDRNTRTDRKRDAVTSKGRPMVKNGRTYKQKPRINATRPVERKDIKQKKRVSSTKPTQRKSKNRKHVSSQNKRKTNALAQRSNQSSKKAKQRSSTAVKSSTSKASKSKSKTFRSRTAKRRVQ